MYGIHNFIVRYTDSNSAIGKFIIILIIIVTIAFIAGIYFTFFHDGVVDIRGCRSFRADNYNPRATINDGSCVFSRERSCNNNGDPTTNNNCSCDIGYGSRNCRKEIDYSNVLIESNNVIIDIVNTFSLIFNNDNKLLTNTISIEDLELDNIYINPNKNNNPPSRNENEPNIIYNTYFSINQYEPEIYPNGRPNFPNLDRVVWARSNISPTKGEPFKLFQLTLKPNTNQGNILYEYADSS